MYFNICCNFLQPAFLTMNNCHRKSKERTRALPWTHSNKVLIVPVCFDHMIFQQSIGGKLLLALLAGMPPFALGAAEVNAQLVLPADILTTEVAKKHQSSKILSSAWLSYSYLCDPIQNLDLPNARGPGHVRLQHIPSISGVCAGRCAGELGNLGSLKNHAMAIERNYATLSWTSTQRASIHLRETMIFCLCWAWF